MTIDLDAEIRRGAEAQRLLDDPVFVRAFATVEHALIDAWLATGDAQERERERLWLMIRLLRRVRALIEEAATTGRLAARQIAEFTRG